MLIKQTKRKLNENMEKIYKFCGNWGKLKKFLEIEGKYAICIISLGGMHMIHV